MPQPDGRALVAAYLKSLRIARGVDQEQLAQQLGVHKNTILRAESVSLREMSDKLETSIAMARCLGGDVSHVTMLRAGILPDKYPLDRLGLSGKEEAATVEVAADVAAWHVESQDARLRDAAQRRGVSITGLRDLAANFQWAAFRDPDKALKVYL